MHPFAGTCFLTAILLIVVCCFGRSANLQDVRQCRNFAQRSLLRALSNCHSDTLIGCPGPESSRARLPLLPLLPLSVLSSDDLILPGIPQNVEVLDAALIRLCKPRVLSKDTLASFSLKRAWTGSFLALQSGRSSTLHSGNPVEARTILAWTANGHLSHS